MGPHSGSSAILFTGLLGNVAEIAYRAEGQNPCLIASSAVLRERVTGANRFCVGSRDQCAEHCMCLESGTGSSHMLLSQF